MTVTINFNVRNPEWYWPAERMEKDGDYYEEFKMLNEGKIPKHIPTWAFKIGFDVIDVKDNRNATYGLEVSSSEASTVSHSVQLDNVTHVTFMGKDEKLDVVISNDIMHSFLGAQQNEGKYYWYFFINGKAEYEKVTDLIWLSKKQLALLNYKF